MQWTDEEHLKDQQNCDQRIKELAEDIKLVEEKAGRLLDLYLEQKLEESVYKKKQNDLFAEKEKLETQLKKIKEGGSSWLELLKEFIDCALQAQKIARIENTNRIQKALCVAPCVWPRMGDNASVTEKFFWGGRAKSRTWDLSLIRTAL